MSYAFFSFFFKSSKRQDNHAYPRFHLQRDHPLVSVECRHHPISQEMIPSLSAEKDDGKDISDDETLSYGGRHLKKPETVEICRSPPGNQSCSKPLLS
jgi:hypothetical protein